MTSTAASAFANGRGGTDWERLWAHGIDEGEAFDVDAPNRVSGDVGSRGGGDRGRARARAGVRKRVRVGVVGARVSRASWGWRLAPRLGRVRGAVEDGEYSEWERGRGRGEDFSSTTFWKGSGSTAYDCTFLCAIDPNKRKKWADVYARVIKPGGVLVSLVFPCGDFEGGPPYALSPEIVKNLLAPPGI